MQAIILAAGMGKRLGAYTKDNTKCMVPINGVTLIDRALGQLSKLGLSRVIIVEGYKGKELREYIGNRYDDMLKIEYINNPIYDKTNNIYSLALASKQMTEDDTLLLESDLIYDTKMFDMILANENPNIALVAKYENWMDGTVVCIDEDNNIVNFVPKKAFRYKDIDTYYKTVNIYKFSKEFSKNKYLPFLEAYCKTVGYNEYYEQVLRVITFLNDSDLKALPIGDEKWYEIDDALDLDIAETLFADDEEMLSRYNSRYGGHWRFPKLLDFCYLVNPYFPTMHMKDEMRNSFDTLLTEYPSGMAVNSLLAGNYFHVHRKYMVVGNGAAELIKSAMEHVNGKLGVIYPTFEEYPNRVDKNRIVAFETKDKDLRYNENDLMKYYNDKEISCLLLINPDNPSGNFIEKKGLIKLLNWSKRRNIKMFIDESFVDFSEDFENNSLITNEILESYKNLVIIKSISKSYGVPGLRLGVLASSDVNMINVIRKDVSIWNINSFGEFYMQIFSKYACDYIKACYKFIAERDRFYTLLNKISWLHVIPSQANYFCVKITDKYTSHELTLILLSKYDIMVKDCDTKTGLKGLNYIRVSVRNKADNDTILAALKEL